MNQKKLSFEFIHKYEDFISLGGGHLTAAICTSSPPMLFDPGVSVFGPLCLNELQACTSSTENLIIALSHSHFDHCGAVSFILRKIPTARLAASQHAADVLQRPNAVELIRTLNAEYEKSMEANLASEDVTFEALQVTYILKDGDCIELDNGRVCRVIETTGHTRGSLSYYFPDTGIAFIGDAAGALEHGFIHSPYLVSYENYISSIENIRGLQPRAICLPHIGILAGEDVQRYLFEAAVAAVAYKDMIEKYLELYKGDQKKVVERITQEEYDAQSRHIQNRQPFILNLRAKVNAVDEWLATQNR
jgi:2-aminobenzoylacetyl-CoA thioesterase